MGDGEDAEEERATRIGAVPVRFVAPVATVGAGAARVALAAEVSLVGRTVTLTLTAAALGLTRVLVAKAGFADSFECVVITATVLPPVPRAVVPEELAA